MPVPFRPRNPGLAGLLRHSCPSCGSEDVRRAHRRSLADWVLSWFGCRPYRCTECHQRFHAMPVLRDLALSSRERRALALRRQTG